MNLQFSRIVRQAVALSFCLVVSAASRANGASSGEPTTKPEKVGMSAERLWRVTAMMQGYVDRQEVAGAVGLIARKGKVVYLEAVGQRDAEAKAPMTTDTIFRIASMTKPIASVGLMMQYEQGAFQLIDPVSKWIPEFKEMKVAVPAPADRRIAEPYMLVAATRPITIQNLLTHTAGLPNSYRGITLTDYMKNVEGATKPGETIADMIARLAKMPLNFEPGSAWEYGRATDVVGRLEEILSGKPLDVYLREKVFEPLGMKDTYFYLPEEKVGRFAALYKPDEKGKIALVEAPTKESRYVKEPHVYFSGAGGLVSTASDYFRFLQMMLNGGELDGARLLGRKTVELMTTNHIGDKEVWLSGPGMGFGLGFAVVKDKGQSALPWSEGSYSWGGAFCTYFWVDPKEEVIGILMAQVRPYTHINIRQDMVVLANQAIVE